MTYTRSTSVMKTWTKGYKGQLKFYEVKLTKSEQDMISILQASRNLMPKASVC